MALKRKLPPDQPFQEHRKKGRGVPEDQPFQHLEKEIIKKKKPEKIEKPQIIRDQETGRISGVKIGEKTILTKSMGDIQAMISRKIPQQTPAGAIEASEVARVGREKERLSERFETLGGFEPGIEPQKLGEILPLTTAGPRLLFPGTEKVQALPSFQAMRNNLILSKISPEKIRALGLEGFRFNPEVLSDELLFKLITSEIDLEVVANGEAVASAFGVFIEGIPLVGKLARKYAGDLISTPSSQIDNIISEISKIEGAVKEDGQYAREGNLNPETALKNMREYEDRLIWLESKIKILMIQSPQLKSSPEEVDTIRRIINDLYGTITDQRTRIMGAAFEQQIMDVDKAWITLTELKEGKEEE